MTNKLAVDEQVVAKIVAVLKALAEPNRLQILAMLMQHDSCNCELHDQLGLSPNLLSHHLRVLERAGLVSHQRDAMDARWIYYTADEAAIAGWQQWFSRFLNPARSQQSPALLRPEGRQTVD
jgi:ArsR family transcriptional regulator